ncbi:hypothetical protein V8E54_011322 [Elaphomyces granulatus]
MSTSQSATVSAERKSLPELKTALGKVVKTRQTTYEKVHAALKKCLEGIFEITNITILKIAKDDKFPALRVSNTLNGIINEFGDPKESPFPLILAYIGHDMVDEDGSLLMAANRKQVIKWRHLRDRYF